jgi:hypothetical protein
MIAAPTFEDVLRRAELFGGSRPLRDRLVSIVFAQPSSVVVRDLNTNRAFWDELTGESWDLFFAGYYAWGGHGDDHPVDLGQPVAPGVNWSFSPRRFGELLSAVESGLASSGIPDTWRFSGCADVVSLMVYGGDPDWPSLRGVELGTTEGPSDRPALGHAIEGLRRWQQEEPDRRFAPGEVVLGEAIPPTALRDALRWTALAAATGIVGNRADVLLGHLLQ